MNTPIIDPLTLTEEQRKIIKQYILRPCLNKSETEGYYWLGQMDFFEWLFGKNMFEQKGETSLCDTCINESHGYCKLYLGDDGALMLTYSKESCEDYKERIKQWVKAYYKENEDNDMDEIDIISYETFKRNNNPTIYEFRDGVKGWIRETIEPTLMSCGWKRCIQEYDYSLFYDEKPKAMAKRLLIKEWGEEWVKDKQFVYYASRCYKNDFQDGLYVYYKPKKR